MSQRYFSRSFPPELHLRAFISNSQVKGRKWIPIYKRSVHYILIEILEHGAFHPLSASVHTSFHFFLPLSISLSLSRCLFPSATLKQSEAGERGRLHTSPWQRRLNDGNKRDLKISFESVWERDGVWSHSSIDSSVLPSNLLPSLFSLDLFISVCTLPLFRRTIMRLNRHLIEQVGLPVFGNHEGGNLI